MTELPSHTHPAVLAVLLDALADTYPAPKPPKWEADAERGLTASVWAACPKCRGERTQNWKGRTVVCDRCKGQGGWKTDAYDQKGSPVHAEHAAELDVLTYTRSVLAWLRSDDHAAWKLCRATHQRRGAIDDSGDYANICYACLGSGLESEGKHGVERARRNWPNQCTACNGTGIASTVDGELQREARSRHPAFALLEDALNRLSLAAPAHVAVLEHVHLTKLPIGQQIALYDDALLLLGDVLGTGFRAPGWARRKADDDLRAQRAEKARNGHAMNGWKDKTARDAEIRRQLNMGRSERWIVKNLHVSKGVVNRAKEAA